MVPYQREKSNFRESPYSLQIFRFSGVWVKSRALPWSAARCCTVRGRSASCASATGASRSRVKISAAELVLRAILSVVAPRNVPNSKIRSARTVRIADKRTIISRRVRLPAARRCGIVMCAVRSAIGSSSSAKNSKGRICRIICCQYLQEKNKRLAGQANDDKDVIGSGSPATGRIRGSGCAPRGSIKRSSFALNAGGEVLAHQ